jgi:putative membrane protein
LSEQSEQRDPSEERELPETRAGQSRADTAWRAIVRWRGIALASVAVVVTVWLALTGQLILYIHPRYVLFTVIMAALALMLIVASFLRTPHDHDDPPTRLQKSLTIVGAAAALVIALAMVVVPPATLSSATALQRDIGGAAVGSDTTTLNAASTASNASFAKFTVLDWSSLLRQSSDPAFYAGKPVDVTGFVTADPDDPDNVFFVSRFVITCCAVDAQPVGVPVYLPDWKQKFAEDKWVRVKGAFAADPSTKSAQQLALLPTATTVVAKPTQPYLF